MAYQNFWFPSQTTGYDTPSGSVRINIHYDDGTAADNDNIAVELLKLSELDMPFEVDPSAGTMRHPQIKMTFNNSPYDSTNNYFEQYSILNTTYKTATFVDFYIDGSIFWQGIIDFNKIKRSDYYLDGATLKYRQIQLTVYDRLQYFWANPTLDLDDVSYADYQTLKTVLQNILAEINISSGDCIFDSNLSIDEDCGNSYDMDDFCVAGFAGTELLKDFLKDFMQGFGAWIYSWNGDYYFVARNGGSTKALDTDHIEFIKKIENANPIEYIDVNAVVNWANKTPYGGTSDWNNVTHQETYGNSDAESGKQFSITVTDLLAFICIAYGGTTSDYPSGTTYPTSGTITSLGDSNQANPPTYLSEDVETGHYVRFYHSGGSPQCFAPITEVDAFYVFFPDGGRTPDTGYDYEVSRNPGLVGYEEYIYKTEMLIQMAAAIYNDFFLTSPDIINIKIRDISEYINIHYRFTIFSNNHRVKGLKVNFEKDMLNMNLVQVT